VETIASRLADLLAQRGDIDELRARADAGDPDAAGQLAGLLAERGDFDGLRTRTEAGDEHAAWRLSGLLIEQGRGDEAERLRRFGLNPDGSIAHALGRPASVPQDVERLANQIRHEPRGVENRTIGDMITSGAPDRAGTAGDRRKWCCKSGMSINRTETVSSTVPGVTASGDATGSRPATIGPDDAAAHAGQVGMQPQRGSRHHRARLRALTTSSTTGPGTPAQPLLLSGLLGLPALNFDFTGAVFDGPPRPRRPPRTAAAEPGTPDKPQNR
jgi:hypothetical protein